MRYSTEPRFRKYVTGHSFLSFPETFGNKYGKKLMDTNWNRCCKNCFKKSSSKNEEAAGNLTGNKIADKITAISKPKEKETKNQKKSIFHQKKRQ